MTVRYETVDGNQKEKKEVMKITLLEKLWTLFTMVILNFVVLFLVYYARSETEKILQKVRNQIGATDRENI